MTHARCILFVFLLGFRGVAGCGDAAPPGFVTEHIVAEPTDSDVVCRGTLDDMETQVMRVALSLGLDLPFPITVFFGPSAVAARCSTVPSGLGGGCTDGFLDKTEVASEAPSVSHEIVHAVRRTNNIRGPSFFEEGIAVVLGGVRPYVRTINLDAASLGPQQGPEALAHYPEPNIRSDDYGVAGHFTAWLLATYGQEVVVAFLNDPRLAETVDDAFLEHFGLTLAEAEQAWRATAAFVYTFGEACDPDRALAWSGDTLEYTAELACEAPHVIGPSLDRITLRSTCFPLAESGTMHVELSAPAGQAILRAQDDCLTADLLSAEHYQDKLLAAGDALDLPFAPCTWEVIVTTDLVAETDFTLRLTR